MINTLPVLQEYAAHHLNTILLAQLTTVPALDLRTAIEHLLRHPGKQVRPLLVYATGQLLKADFARLHPVAVAVELMHLYALVHDDLPSMDNADYRRGQLSCHKLYGEGMAILVGDALFALSMQLLAAYPATLTAEQRLQMVITLSEAAGPFGMVSGQALDITTLHNPVSLGLLEHLYLLKTGRLLMACCEMARLASGDEDELTKLSLQQFSQCLALAFQIQDDLLDQEDTPNSVLSTADATAAHVAEKCTYPVISGVRQAKAKVNQLYEEALTILHTFNAETLLLGQLTQWLWQRTY